MPDKTAIEWADATWNPTIGCTKVSPGCYNCYAERIAERFRGTQGHSYENGFDLRLMSDRIYTPKKWKKPRIIFVNSMSDLFHKEIPYSFLDQVFKVMEDADHHTYMILTKRSSIMRSYIKWRYNDQEVPYHIWLGVSIETENELVRMEHLRQINVPIRFISFEPLIDHIGSYIDLTGISLAIVGGESGPNARPIRPFWVRNIREACLRHNTNFFFKQWGGKTPKENGRTLDGEIYDNFPPLRQNEDMNFIDKL